MHERTLRELVVEAPAKINLYLAVTGRRADGYHDLATFMQKLQLGDTLRLRVGSEPGVRLACAAKELPVDERNLAVRAALAFLRATGIGEGVDIALEKRIPVAAGLGGGSSDAAAVLNGLSQLFPGKLGAEQLFAMALAIGADVPFLLSDHAAAWATGVGERLQRAAPLADCWIVLVNPGFPVSTKWAFEAFAARRRSDDTAGVPSGPVPPAQMAVAFGETDNLALTTGGNPYILGREKDRTIKTEPCLVADEVALWNDLELVTIGRYPELSEIKAQLLADGARGALMSGSGPTVFGLFDDEQLATVSCASFSRRYGDDVFLAKPQ